MLLTKRNHQDGYVLPYLLVTFLLITTMLILSVNLIYFYNKHQVKKYQKKKLELACYTAIQQYMAHNIFVPLVSIKEKYSLNVDSTDVTLNCSYKGLFLQINAVAKTSPLSSIKDSASVTCLLSDKLSLPFENAVVISKSSLNPVVAGNTKIQGNIVSSANKFKTGILPGIGKASLNWINGKINVEEMIPQKLFKDSLITKNIITLNNSFPPGAKIIYGNITIDQNNLAQYDSLKYIYVRGDLTINGHLLNDKRKVQKIFVGGVTKIESETKSNIDLEIYCDSTITIGSASELENVILYSKSSLTINRDVLCKNAQFFSAKGIEVNKAVLLYPSILCVYADTKKSNNKDCYINISASRVNGSTMLLTSEPGSNKNNSKISIKESVVQGIVYSENNTELYSSLVGALYTYNVLYYKKPTEYFNWFVDLNISRINLDHRFLQPIGFSSTSKLAILREKWNY